MKTYIPKNTDFFFVPASDFLAAEEGNWQKDLLARQTQFRDHEYTNSMGAADLEGWYWWTCCPGCLPDSEASGPFETEEEARADAGEEVEDEVYALCQELDVEPSEIEEESHTCYGLRVFSVGRAEYAVGTDDEADEARDQALDSYLDDTGILDSIPENLRCYFDRDAWKRDARYDGRGHALASYDGDEIELEGDLYAFRIN